MKILCSTYWYPEYNGDIHATYVHDINRHYRIVDPSSEVFVVTPNYNGKSLPYEEMDGVRVYRFDFRVPDEFTYGQVAQSKKTVFKKIQGLISMAKYIAKNFYYTRKYARMHHVDVIHAHWVIPSGFPAFLAARLLRKPCFITMHGGDVYYNKEEGYVYPKLWYIRPFLKYTLRHADRLTAITDDCRVHALNAGAPDGNIVIITNGADVRRFSKKNSDGVGAVREKFGLKGQKTIFACRQLIPRKGIRFLVQAMPRILKKHPRVKLIVAGDGIERQSLEAMIADLGIRDRVFLVGWVPNDQLPAYYNAADISVIPSLEEGFGIPAAEAMGCELPVVSSDAGGLVEVVDHGKNGIIVPKGDAAALADAIIKLLDRPEIGRRYGRAGRKKAEDVFSWDRTALSFLELFRKHLKKGKK